MNAPHDPAELEQKLLDLQQQLLQAQKLSTIGSLASSMTHEFNNILTTVINYAKLGLRHKDAATRDKAFDKILTAGQRAARITTGLLSYARRGADRREPTDLAALTKEVLVLVEKDLQVHRIRLQTTFDAAPLVAELNASQVQQVLLNLIVNARQAMESGGQLTVAVRAGAEEGTGEIIVRDSGHGIPPDALRKIFDPYFTTKKADAQGQGGTGLGLSLAREIIEAHQGRIRVESKPGQGTTFTLKLPLAKRTQPQPMAGPHLSPASRPAPRAG
ncbi:MAG: sensor histidine kinase [Planctomycetales bacterium]